MSCFFYSCNDWIELEPEDSLAKETFFNTQEDFNQAITGLYAILRPTDADAVGVHILGICIGRFVRMFVCGRTVGHNLGLIFHEEN